MDNMTQFKPTAAMITAAETVLMAMAYTETVRPIVEEYQKKSLAFWRFKMAEKHKIRRGNEAVQDEIILDPKKSYLLDDHDAENYYKDCHEAALKAGFNVKYGYCPLLIAESLQITAEWVLMDTMKPVTGIDGHEIYDMDMRQQYIDLTLRLLAPYVKNPLKKAA
jgi:hypothetical protein